MKLLAKIALPMALGLSVTANASFVNQDLASTGDQLLTLDTETNLQWLDITATSGLTFQQIQLGAGGWTKLGFRPAVRSELETLFGDAGVILGPPRSIGNTSGINLLTDHLGCNLCFPGSGLSGGSVLFADQELQSQGMLGHAVYDVDVYGEGFAFVDDALGDYYDIGAFNLTTVLVRDYPINRVPEPASIVLFASGCLMLAWRLRSR